jgi:hypothetical protein
MGLWLKGLWLKGLWLKGLWLMCLVDVGGLLIVGLVLIESLRFTI